MSGLELQLIEFCLDICGVQNGVISIQEDVELKLDPPKPLQRVSQKLKNELEMSYILYALEINKSRKSSAWAGVIPLWSLRAGEWISQSMK